MLWRRGKRSVHYAKIEVAYINNTCIHHVRSQLARCYVQETIQQKYLSKDMHIQGVHHYVSMDMYHGLDNSHVHLHVAYWANHSW
jgi:hypothetical protein